MHKELFVLGLLLREPASGYDLHQTIRAHGDFYRDLKKANLYYMLSRLVLAGYLDAHGEPSARGARPEKTVYGMTDKGKARFADLLARLMRLTPPVPTGVDIALGFLPSVSKQEALTLLQQRQEAIETIRRRIEKSLKVTTADGSPASLVASHDLAMVDAEVRWLESAIDRVRSDGSHAREAHVNGGDQK